MNIDGSAKVSVITILFLLIFVNATVMDTYAPPKFKIKPPPIRFGKGHAGDLTKPIAERTRTTQVQVESTEIAKPAYKIEFRSDLVSKVDKYIREFNTDLFNSLVAKVVGILPYLISK
jgi:hypothetical protein